MICFPPIKEFLIIENIFHKIVAMISCKAKGNPKTPRNQIDDFFWGSF